MATAKPSSATTVALVYESIRNLTSPEEKANGAKSYFANIPWKELLKLDTAGNLRDYVPEHSGKRRSQVHKAIAHTLTDNPDRFIQLSSGITVSAADLEIDEGKKVVKVKRGSIINGAQTQGEIRRYFAELEETEDDGDDDDVDAVDEVVYHARVEFIIDPQEDQVVEAAIARNTATNVQRISMAGKKAYFEDLNDSFQKIYPSLKLSKSETDTGDDFIDTLKLLQILWVMIPEDMLPKGKRNSSEARLKSYKNRAYCLVDFERDVLEKGDDAEAAARYRYFVDMAGYAWREYEKWSHHEGWKGRYLKETSRQIVRHDDGHTVSDGVLFPILAAMSQFVKLSKNNKWALVVPDIFDEQEMIDAARDQLSSHGGSPMSMGRDAAVYDALGLLPKMVLRLVDRLDAKRR